MYFITIKKLEIQFLICCANPSWVVPAHLLSRVPTLSYSSHTLRIFCNMLFTFPTLGKLTLSESLFLPFLTCWSHLCSKTRLNDLLKENSYPVTYPWASAAQNYVVSFLTTLPLLLPGCGHNLVTLAYGRHSGPALWVRSPLPANLRKQVGHVCSFLHLLFQLRASGSFHLLSKHLSNGSGFKEWWDCEVWLTVGAEISLHVSIRR